MADQRIQYTEEMVGAGHPTKSDTLNRLSLVEHNSDGTHKGAGASSKLLVTAEAAFDASMDFNPSALGDETNYDVFILRGSRVVPATDGVNPRIRLSQGSGFVSSADYKYAGFGVGHDADTLVVTRGTGQTAILLGPNVGDQTWEGLSFALELHNPAGTDNWKKVIYQVSFLTPTGVVHTMIGSGVLANTTTAIDGIQFSFGSGDVESGFFTFEAIRKS